MEKKKILFIINNLIGGGAIKTVSNLSQFMEDEFDITIIALNKTEQSYKFGGRVIALNNQNSRNYLKKIKNYIDKIKVVKSIKRENKFDYSISFLVWSDTINILTKSRNSGKTIISIRNLESVEYRDKWFDKFKVRMNCNIADKIVSISEEVKDDLINNFGVKKEKVVTIWNPSIVDISEVQCSSEFIGMFHEGKTCISLGNLKYQKGQWHLIRAFSEVVKKDNDARLIILGEGEDRKYLQQLINGFNLEKNVFLPGFVENPYNYVKKADIFIFSSLFEGLGNAMMEALSCKIPIISTDYRCGAREILSPKTDFKKKVRNNIEYCEYGILVPVFDGVRYKYEDKITLEEKLMANAINDLIGDKNRKKYYADKAAERSKDFEINNVINEWKEMFNKLDEDEIL